MGLNRKEAATLLRQLGYSERDVQEAVARNHGSRTRGRDSVRDLGPAFATLCRDAGIPAPDPEHRFHPVRRWRFDFAWPDERVALEVEGGIWTRGRHVRGKGALNDMEKYSEAAARGWRILRVTPDHLLRDDTLDLVRRALAWG